MSGRYWDGIEKNHPRRDAKSRDDDRDRGYRRRSRSRDRDRHRRRYSRSSSRSKSRSRSRSRSRYDRERRHRHKSHRSPSPNHREKREERPRNGTDNKTTPKSSSQISSHRNDKSSESTQDGFDFAKLQDNNTQYIGGVESEEERKKIHEQMQERLRKLKESEPKRIQPTKPSYAAVTPFANDGSFLEKFKEMQERFTQQQETQQREDERLRLLPMIGRRRGGKILKTGIVEKPKRIEDNPADGPKDAWSLYLQEVKRYKNATCDPDAPSRSLVK